MNPTILTLRVNRRALGAVVLQNDTLTLVDGRHLTSKPQKTVEAASRFIGYLLALTKPTLLVVDAPKATDDSVTGRISAAITDVITRNALRCVLVSRSELLAAYGIRGLRHRRELREIVRPYWPELATVKGQVEPFVVDAAAAALYAECRIHLERVPT